MFRKRAALHAYDIAVILPILRSASEAYPEERWVQVVLRDADQIRMELMGFAHGDPSAYVPSGQELNSMRNRANNVVAGFAAGKQEALNGYLAQCTPKQRNLVLSCVQRGG